MLSRNKYGEYIIVSNDNANKNFARFNIENTYLNGVFKRCADYKAPITPGLWIIYAIMILIGIGLEAIYIIQGDMFRFWLIGALVIVALIVTPIIFLCMRKSWNKAGTPRYRLVIFKSRYKEPGGGEDVPDKYYLIDDYDDFYMCPSRYMWNKIELNRVYAVCCYPESNLFGKVVSNTPVITGFECIK